MQFIIYTKHFQVIGQYLAFSYAAHHMHSRLETYAITLETLQTAAYLVCLFQDSHIVPHTRQHGSCREPAKTTSYNDYTHVVITSSVLR